MVISSVVPWLSLSASRVEDHENYMLTIGSSVYLIIKAPPVSALYTQKWVVLNAAAYLSFGDTSIVKGD